MSLSQGVIVLYKRVICFCLCIASVFSLSGCGVGEPNMESLSLEEVQSKRASMTVEEQEGKIYQYVADRIMIDSKKLLNIEAKELDVINNLCSKINEDLATGNSRYLSREHVNYMLTEFLRTPYEWQQSNVSPIGFDPASRLYFVDVTYSTTGAFKSVIPTSSIPLGDTNADLLKKARYEQWTKYLEQAYRGSNKQAQLYDNFYKSWGSPDAIMAEQQGVDLATRTSEYGAGSGGIGRLTYEGLLTSGYMTNHPATMTFRFVMKYRYNLGEETDLAVDAVYLKNFELKPEQGLDNFLNSFQLQDPTGVEVLKPFVDNTILSYNRAVEESNYVGLNSLFKDFGKHDKYYEMLSKYTYCDTDGYSYKIIEKTGTSLLVQVDRVNHIRAKGEQMSMPTYDEVLIFNMVLSEDDKIRIQGIYPMKITLSGEPLSVIKNVTGVSDLIQFGDKAFTDTNKTAVEQCITDFGQVVINGETEGANFLKLVDLGIQQSVLQQMMSNIKAINADKKVTYVISWDTQTNVYCSVTVREIFMGQSGNYDTEAQIDVAKSNGVWKVIGYNRTLNVKTSNINFKEDDALCTNNKGGNASRGANYGKTVSDSSETSTGSDDNKTSSNKKND